MDSSFLQFHINESNWLYQLPKGKIYKNEENSEKVSQRLKGSASPVMHAFFTLTHKNIDTRKYEML